MNAALTRADRNTPVSLDDVVAPSVMEALHCLRVAITVFDAEERLIFANDHFGYMFRSLPFREALVGRRYEDIIRLEAGEIADGPARQDIDELIASRRASLFHGDYAPRDLPLSDGRIIEVKTRKTPNGGWIILWSDVTLARHNLEHLRAAIALSADAFAFYDRYDRLTLCNDEYAALNGVTSPDAIKGFGFNDLVERIANTTVAAPDRAAWIEKRHELHRVPAGAMTMVLSDGTAYVMRDRAAADGGRIVVFTDVTEHHRVEKALAEQARTLADTRKALAASKARSDAQANYLADLANKLDQTAASADSTKKTLLRTMSHELKTPLNAIIGFSDLLGTLADSASPDQIREYAGLIHTGGNNLLRMLNQIMDLTKISAGRYEMSRQPLDAALSLWTLKDRFDGAAAAKSIAIEIDDSENGLVVEVDESAYNTMLGNLVENAVNFTPDGGTVRLKAARDGDAIRISVTDSGPGVAEQDLTRILEPFEQGGRSTTDHPAGAGLGLTLVKALCEMHRGTLTLTSAPGQGLTASVVLPAK
ncbi:PAS domain-containing sensor histidine kinase [Rhizomicrobium electricum]|uniref:histidine kinase n=1 Tax=Rhizomicrobium electricum TaxID=480070 RepID=A0ABN1EI80_9PROT|nr:PAS domain-containing sensor histidine kinase [Rhizomicrobium electricum]NIJ48374.1 signal transduction histidine kinase [Rhizomicrobium electricum]